MFDDAEKKAILEIAENAGYTGFFKGKYQFGNNSTVSEKKVMKYLNLKDSASKISCVSLIPKIFTSNVSDLEFNVCRVLREVELVDVTEVPTDISTGLADYLGNLDILVSVKDDTPFVVRPPTDEEPNYLVVPEVSPSAVAKVRGFNMAELMLDPRRLAEMAFNPLRPENIYTVNKRGVEHAVLNTFNPPEWLRKKVQPAYDGVIATIFNHLFPDSEDREYVLDWLHYAITSRNETVLAIVGARGTGKSTAFSNILRQLVGSHYFRLGSQSMLDDKFNAEMLGSRVVCLEEVSIGEAHQLSRIKAFCNSRINVEKKGVDSLTADNFASIVMLSNHRDSFKLEPQERRFSLPSNTEDDLSLVLDRDEIARFLKRIEDPQSEEIAEFGHFLLGRRPKHSNSEPLKGKYFFTICRYSMSEWKTAILQYVITEGNIGTPMNINNIRKAFKKDYGEEANFPYKRGAIDTFLADYKHEGRFRIGHSVPMQDGRGRTIFGIMPNTEFLKHFGENPNKGTEEDALGIDEPLDATDLL